MHRKAISRALVGSIVAFTFGITSCGEEAGRDVAKVDSGEFTQEDYEALYPEGIHLKEGIEAFVLDDDLLDDIEYDKTETEDHVLLILTGQAARDAAGAKVGDIIYGQPHTMRVYAVVEDTASRLVFEMEPLILHEVLAGRWDMSEGIVVEEFENMGEVDDAMRTRQQGLFGCSNLSRFGQRVKNELQAAARRAGKSIATSMLAFDIDVSMTAEPEFAFEGHLPAGIARADSRARANQIESICNRADNYLLIRGGWFSDNYCINKLEGILNVKPQVNISGDLRVPLAAANFNVSADVPVCKGMTRAIPIGSTGLQMRPVVEMGLGASFRWENALQNVQSSASWQVPLDVQTNLNIPVGFYYLRDQRNPDVVNWGGAPNGFKFSASQNFRPATTYPDKYKVQANVSTQKRSIEATAGEPDKSFEIELQAYGYTKLTITFGPVTNSSFASIKLIGPEITAKLGGYARWRPEQDNENPPSSGQIDVSLNILKSMFGSPHDACFDAGLFFGVQADAQVKVELKALNEWIDLKATLFRMTLGTFTLRIPFVASQTSEKDTFCWDGGDGQFDAFVIYDQPANGNEAPYSRPLYLSLESPPIDNGVGKVQINGINLAQNSGGQFFRHSSTSCNLNRDVNPSSIRSGGEDCGYIRWKRDIQRKASPDGTYLLRVTARANTKVATSFKLCAVSGEENQCANGNMPAEPTENVHRCFNATMENGSVTTIRQGSCPGGVFND